MAVNSKMDLALFRAWMEEQGAACVWDGKRLNCIIAIDHIEPGLWAALFAVQTVQGLMVTELGDYFITEEEARKALEDSYSSTLPAQVFKDWVTGQYLTDKAATVEKLEI